MKKVFTAIIFVILMLIIACNQGVPFDKNLWLIDQLKGNVKSMSRIEYEVKDTLNQIIKGKVVDDKEGFGNIRLTYNNKGYWTEYRSHSATGSPILTEKPEYSKDGKMRMIARRDYKYDTILWRRYDYKHDRNTINISDAHCYNAADSLLWRITWKYDNDGNAIESYRYNSTGVQESKKFYVHDEKGNLLKVTTYNLLNDEITTSAHKYDENGNRTEICEYKGNDSLTKRIVYRYNDNGLCSESQVYNAENKLDKNITYKYRYDEKGNWIERVEYLNDKAVKITEREIEYFAD
jgi:hypothetical protein